MVPTTFASVARLSARLSSGSRHLTLVLAGAKIDSVSVRFALLGIPAFLCLSLSRTKLPFAAAIASMLVVTLFQPDPRGEILHAERTFFGIYRVNQDASGEYRTLTHGTTLHGVQSVSESRRHEPLSYYHRTGPLGDVFQVVSQAPASQSMSPSSGSVLVPSPLTENLHRIWTFFEIDPAVEAIARNRDYFSYLADCGEACGVIIGDARQSLTAVSAQYGADGARRVQLRCHPAASRNARSDSSLSFTACAWRAARLPHLESSPEPRACFGSACRRGWAGSSSSSRPCRRRRPVG